MTKDTKIVYDVPRTSVIHLTAEKFVCASGQTSKTLPNDWAEYNLFDEEEFN